MTINVFSIYLSSKYFSNNSKRSAIRLSLVKVLETVFFWIEPASFREPAFRNNSSKISTYLFIIQHVMRLFQEKSDLILILLYKCHRQVGRSIVV